jgi:hypothetical protein
VVVWLWIGHWNFLTLPQLTFPNYNLKRRFRLFSNIVCLLFTIHKLSPVGLLSHTSPLVPASKADVPPSWIPNCPPSHSHSDHSIVRWLVLLLSKGSIRVGVFLSSPEDGNRHSFQNVVFYSSLEYRTMDKFHKPNDSECYTPSWEPFKFYLLS